MDWYYIVVVHVPTLETVGTVAPDNNHALTLVMIIGYSSSPLVSRFLYSLIERFCIVPLVVLRGWNLCS